MIAIVCGWALVGRWAVRALADDPSYYPASEALPWVALGWALYGLVLVLITVAGRAKVTTRNFPATAAGLVVNVVLLVTLVGPLGIAGAGIALCGAYVVIVTVLPLSTDTDTSPGTMVEPVPIESLCASSPSRT